MITLFGPLFGRSILKARVIHPVSYTHLDVYKRQLWTDPEKGLFRQYLHAGKVPGAKTVADVKKFYESKVPMDRGCFPQDVAKAIFYCVEQQYETGQAIPVTGGQVMLH